MSKRLAIAIILLTAATAHAGNHEVSLTESNRALRSDSANAVTPDSMVGGALGYAHRLDIPVLPDLTIWGTGTFGWGVADGTMFQTLTTDLSTLTFSVGARARYPLHRLIVASARIDVGTARTALALHDDAGHTARDHGWGAMTAGALALDLFATNKPSFALGLRFELGYVATSGVAMTATPDSQSDGTLQLQMTAAGLGSLDLSGPVFAASVVSQF